MGLAANQRQQVSIPAASVIEIVSVPTKYKQMIDVLWDGEPLIMFIHDVEPNLMSRAPDLIGRQASLTLSGD